MTYTTMTPPAEAIEIRFGDGSTYLGSADLGDGTIRHSLIAKDGMPEAMSNAAPLTPSHRYPRKVVPGWQAEVLAYFTGGHRKVVEIR